MPIRFGSIVITLLCISCTSLQKLPENSEKWKEVTVLEPVYLELQTQLNKKEIAEYEYTSSKATTDERRIKVTRKDSVKFTVESTVVGATPEGYLKVDMTTTAKEGAYELNDLAFPELGEEIRFIMTKESKVIRAGGYSEESIFFIQPIPLPDHSVKKGDTWVQEQTWISRHNSIPLKLELVAILSRFIDCGKDDICADIEISGRVTIPKELLKGRFESRTYGRFLFALRGGSMVWSNIHTDENLRSGDKDLEVHSLMTSKVSDYFL